MIRISVILFVLVVSLFANDEKKYLALIKPIVLKISNIKDNTFTIKKGDLEIGKTGIVLHVFKNKEKIILANTEVIKSNKEESTLRILDFNSLMQEAMPTIKKDVQVGDILVLSYLYDKSILISPNLKIFNELKNKFFMNSFLHPDLFASELKINNGLYPTQEDIQSFVLNQNLGTIFIVVNKKIYIIDSLTFKILADFNIEYDDKKEYKMPFYTRVEKIESSLIGIDFSDKKLAYEKHYKKLLGLK